MSANMLEFYEDATVRYEIGDVNHDGILNVIDITLIQKYITRIDLSDDTFDDKLADVDEDGMISIKDATMLQVIIALGNN